MTVYVIITGGPCGGKTTTINHLASLGNSTLQEAATAVFKQMRHEGIENPYADKKFESNVIAMQKDLMQDVRTTHAFTDRSPFDALWYFKKFKPTEPCEELEKKVAELKNSFFKTVFVLQQLGICEDNGVRHETVKEAEEIEEGLSSFYKEHGFEVVLIEKKSIEKRTEDIVTELKSRGLFLNN
jgi:predicted ATPase